MEFSREFGSKFPNEIMTLSHFKDIDDTVAPIVSQFYNYLESNDINSAASLLAENEVLLRPYYADMKTLNRFEEEIYNTSLVALSHQITIVSNNEPVVDCGNYSYWLKEF